MTLHGGHRIEGFLRMWSERYKEPNRAHLRQSNGEQDSEELSKQRFSRRHLIWGILTHSLEFWGGGS